MKFKLLQILFVSIFYMKISYLMAQTKVEASLTERPVDSSLSTLSTDKSQAEEKTISESVAPDSAKTKREFNFDGDVIEAQKNKPILILDSQDVSLDIEDIIYNRSNFDEYFQLEKNNKPQFAK